uniref:Uncharacterized protein n=1 Tax=Rhizophora mucronata TaxID=61149 RepID=A0A2P2NLG0_RHIMU
MSLLGSLCDAMPSAGLCKYLTAVIVSIKIHRPFNDFFMLVLIDMERNS